MYPNTLTIILGFGGSGGKTVAALADLMTNDPKAAKFAQDRIHVLLCDTDEGDLAKLSREVERAFNDRCPGLKLPVETFSLSSNVDAFCDLVQERTKSHGPESIARMKDNWWYLGDTPFSATGLPLSATAGAGQCPLVSQFLAWDKLREFPRVLKEIDAYARNERHMENFSVDLVIVGSLAGGTGRGCWQTLSLKAREFFGQQGQACRPIGFFFDQSVFADVQSGRPEQGIKLKVNSLTGLSELAMWLRSDRKMAADAPNAPRERRFALPSFENPEDRQIDALDTDRYMPESERARVGRSPVHKAYVFTNESASVQLGSNMQVYRVVAAAIFGRICVGQLRSADANQPARAATTATSVLYVPTSDIRKAILNAAKIERARALTLGRAEGQEVLSSATKDSVEFKKVDGATFEARAGKPAAWLSALLQLPDPADISGGHSSEGSRVRSVVRQLRERTAANDDADAGDTLRQALKDAPPPEDLAAELDAFCASTDSDIQASFLSALESALNVKEREPLASDDAATRSKRDRANHRLDRCVQEILSRLWDGKAEPGMPDGFESIRTLSRESGGSLGVPHAAILKLQECVGKLRKEIHDRRENASAQHATSRSGILDGYNKARRRWVIWPLRFALRMSSVPKRVRDNTFTEARTLRGEIALAPMLAAFEALVNQLHDSIQEWKRNSQDVIDVVDRTVRNLDRAQQSTIDDYFTRCSDDDGAQTPRGSQPVSQRVARRVVSRLRSDDSDPISRMIRRLRPLYDEATFRECVAETLGDGNGDLFRSELVDELLNPDLADRKSLCYRRERRTSERTLFRSTFESQLLSILSRQDAPAATMQRFALPTVLEDLVNFWAELYNDYKGDVAFARQIRDTVFNLCGIDFEALDDAHQRAAMDGALQTSQSFPVPDLHVIMASTSLKLAAKCDPLVRTPDERTSQGDLVSIFLPDVSFGGASAPHAQWLQRLERDWQDDKANFRHVSPMVFTDNPYMLLASTDHPKKDFDVNGWTGWTSFKYWDEPGIQSWLSMCEDPSGGSVFLEGKDDSIGLGYIHPSFVRDAHWVRRRWRPWVDERRQKTQDRRKWEALAYALFGNKMYSPSGGAVTEKELPFLKEYHEFIERWNSMRPVAEDFPQDKWLLPLLVELGGDSKGPRFLRRLFVEADGHIRQVGTDPTGSENTWSTRQFVQWFKDDESRDLLNAVWAEQCLFAKVILRRDDDFHDVLSPRHRDAIRRTLHEYVRRWKEHIGSASVTRREDDRNEQIAFLEEFLKVLEDKNFDVLKSFGAVSSHD